MGRSSRVKFMTHDGVTLRGDFFPVKKEKAPMIIMTQGVGCEVEIAFPSPPPLPGCYTFKNS